MTEDVQVAAPVTPAAQEQVKPAAPEIHVESNFETEKPAAQQTDTQATSDGDESKGREKDGLNKRFSELTHQRKAAEERARIIEDQNRQLLDLLSKGKQPEPNAAPNAKAEEAPKLEDFDKYEKYLAAQARWEAKQIYDTERKADQERTQRAHTEATQRENVERQHKAIVEQKATLDTMTKEAEKKYPDFYATVFEQPPDLVPISTVVGDAILKSKEGFEIAYFLGKNPAEAQRIAQLSPVEQLVEVGMIRASLKQLQTKSAAPKPIDPVGQRSKTGDGPSMDDDMDTWVQKRNAQEAARKGRFR